MALAAAEESWCQPPSTNFAVLEECEQTTQIDANCHLDVWAANPRLAAERFQRDGEIAPEAPEISAPAI